MIGSLLATIGAIAMALLFILTALAGPVLELHDLTPAPPPQRPAAERAAQAARQAPAMRAGITRSRGRHPGGNTHRRPRPTATHARGNQR